MPPAPFPVQKYARLAGFLYLLVIILGLFGEAVVRTRLVVSGDAAATASNILAAELLWRLGIAGQWLLLLCAVGLTLLWYVLLRPAGKQLTLLVVFFALISLAVESVSALHLQMTLAPLKSAALAHAADPSLAGTMAYLSIVAHAQAFGLALVFFGVECLIVGHLIRKSGYLPRIVGILMQVAGICYLINSFSMALSPALQDVLFPLILVPSFIGESVFCLWLLIKGVDTAAWHSKAKEAAVAA